MELIEPEIQNDEIGNVKTEIFDLAQLLDTSFLNVTLINSPDKITNEVLIEFSSNSKTVNLITLDRNKWPATIINFDVGFLYVNAPVGFKIYIGELVIVQFPSEHDDYIIQTVLHKYTIQKFMAGPAVPVLSLRFLDPRMDKRYQVPVNTNLNYCEISDDVFWMADSKYNIVRTTGFKNGEHNGFIIKETIGKGSGLISGVDKDVSYLDNEIGELRNNMIASEVLDIAVGGCAIVTDNKHVKPGSKMLLSLIINIKDTAYISNMLELQLFAVVRSVRPDGEGKYRCGLKFANKIDDEFVHHFFEECLSVIDPVLKVQTR